MSEPKWTPGPWKSRGRVNHPTASVLGGMKDDDWGHVVWMPYGCFTFGQVGAAVCTANRDQLEASANSRLIAAAPDLYEEHAQDDQLFLKMATVFLNDAIANHIPIGLKEEVLARLRRGTPAISKAIRGDA